MYKVHGDEIISEPCPDCNSLNEWWRNFESTVDDLIVHSNTHTCRQKTDSTKGDKKKKKKEKNAVAHKAGVKGCLNAFSWSSFKICIWKSEKFTNSVLSYL